MESSPPGRFRPPTRAQLIGIVLALCFVSGVIGWRIGQGSEAHRGSADVGFLFDMISHHEQAIIMSSIELFDGDVRDVKTFAEEIHRFQSYEIGLMERHLDRLGFTRYEAPETAMRWMGDGVPREEMPGLASPSEMESLRTTDDVDEWFITLMVDHHAAGAAMADAAAARADDDQVRELATRMAKIQRGEIAELLGAAERAGLRVPVAGATWDVYGSDAEHGGHDG